MRPAGVEGAGERVAGSRRVERRATELCLMQGPDATLGWMGPLCVPGDLCVPWNREPLSGTNRGAERVWRWVRLPPPPPHPGALFLAGCFHHTRLNHNVQVADLAGSAKTKNKKTKKTKQEEEKKKWFELGWRGCHFQCCSTINLSACIRSKHSLRGAGFFFSRWSISGGAELNVPLMFWIQTKTLCS